MISLTREAAGLIPIVLTAALIFFGAAGLFRRYLHEPAAWFFSHLWPFLIGACAGLPLALAVSRPLGGLLLVAGFLGNVVLLAGKVI